MQQWADTLQIRFITRISFVKTSPEIPHVIHTANAAQDSALIQHTATNKFTFAANKHEEMLGHWCIHDLVSGITRNYCFPLTWCLLFHFPGCKTINHGRGGNRSFLLLERGRKELQDISSPSKKHQGNSLAPTDSTEKLAMICTATGTGAGWIFVRVLACVGWGWLGFFAFIWINLEMECRGASFIVAQLRKCWFAVFVKV